MLRYFAFLRLRNYPQDTIFQQNSAPPHYRHIVREYLDRKFPNRWIGRGGPISWPPRSPDLTACDFFLWGYLNDTIYSERIDNIEQLKSKITNAIRSFDTNILENVYQNL